MKRLYSNCIESIHTSKKIFLSVFVLILTIVSSYATVKTSTGTGDWDVAGTWTPSGIPGANDTIVIASGHTVTMQSITGNPPITTKQITINGTLKQNENRVYTVNGHWINNGTYSPTGSANPTVIMNTPGTYIGGSSATSFGNLTINPGTSNIIALANTNMTILNGGTLTLSSGFFKVGSGNNINFPQVGNINSTGGGNFSNSADGLGDTDADGGTINMATPNGDALNITSNSGNVLVLNNIITTGNGNWRLNVANTNSVRVNGMLKVNGGSSNQWSSTGKSFYWGPASTLFVDHAGQQYTAGTEWNAASGTIGSTTGYPNNVTITNIGPNAGGFQNGNGWVPPVGALAINGTFTVGDGVTDAQIDFTNLTSFSAKNFVLNANSRFTAPTGTMTITGDWTDNQGTQTAGSKGFWFNGSSTVIFSGGATSTINVAGASVNTEKFDKVIVSNGTTVKLNDPISISTGGTLTLTSGYVTTSATNSLTVLNTANSAVVGGSPTAYVDGPLKWSLPTGPGNIDYVFPVGDKSNNGGAYLPLKLTTPPGTIAATVMTVQGNNLNPAGTYNTPLTSISNTEYWSMSSTAAYPTGAKVDLTRPAPITPFDAIGQNNTAPSGVYSSIGGSPVTGTEIGGGSLAAISAGGTGYLVMAAKIAVPLTVERVGGTTNYDASCNPIPNSGTLIVGGVGGTGPYEYSMTSATGPWQTSATFSGLSVGTYTVWVRDNATPTKTVASKVLPVLGPLQINDGNGDITFCNIQPVTLTATNAQNPNATFLWSPGGQTTASITVTPTVNTTYTVTSTVPFTGSNLLTNGGFEGGNPTGFSTASGGYTNYTGATYGTTPGSGALYQINTAATLMCSNFANAPGAHEGTKYFIGDGGVVAQEIFRLNLTGLSANTQYTFSYWYMRGSVSAPFTPIETSLGASVLGTVVASNTAWAQASYTITTNGAGAATIILKNTSPTTSTNGNDFLIDDLQLQLLTTCTVTASINVSIDCTVMPVELIKFNAVKQGAGALISWTTASEKNSSYFIVEKSTDGIHFTPIGRVEAQGNSSTIQNYSLVDPSIEAGITYYRLVEYDKDGTSQRSEIKAVSKESISGVQVTPNPNNGVFVVTFDNSGDAKIKVVVINSLGQIVYTSPETETNFTNVDISALASGVYYLQVNSSEEKVVKKIIKE